MNPPPRLGTLIAQALDAVHDHAVATAQLRHDHPDRARAFAESSRAQRALWTRLAAAFPEEYEPNYVLGDPSP